MSLARYLLDTNIVIFIRRARPPHLVERFGALRPGEAVLSVITYGELLFGLERAQNKASARRVLGELLS
ncbi:MAG TPA: PIN domain-containing protein, partial [Propylenella sp.]